MKARRLWPVAVCVLLIALCWALGIGCGDVTFPGLEKEGMTFYRGGNKSYYLSGGDEYGILNSGPGFTLPAGRYRLNVTVDSDGDNLLHIAASNGAVAEPQTLTLGAHSWNNHLSFTLLEDARDLQLCIEFREGTYLRLHGVDLIMTDVTDGTWMLTLAALAACVLYMLAAKGVITRENRGLLVLIGAAVLAASVPALRNNLYGGHDTLFHQMRLYNVVDALRSGQFPVRMGGYGYNGYGSAASIFYPDVFLYGPALMMLAGASVQCAMRVYIIAMNAISAATMYACGKRIFDCRAAGACASILYVLASYRLMDIYTRDALGEYTAMAMLPLFVLGLWEVVFGDVRRWRTLVLGASLVFMSHLLSTVLCAALAMLFGAAGIVRIVRERRLTAIVKAALATALVCLFLLVPLADYAAQGIGDSGTFATSVSANMLQTAELFVTKEGADKGLGCGLLLGLAVLGYAALTERGESRKMRTALLLAALGAAAAVAATDIFPWAQIERLSRGLVNYLQFPMRLMMFADVFLALGAGYGMVCLAGAQRELAALAALVVCVGTAYPQIGDYTIKSEEQPEFGLRYADPYIRYKSYTDVITGSYLEYALPGSDLSATRDQGVMAEEGLTLSGYQKAGTTITGDVRADQDTAVSLPLFAFDGYRAQVDGKDMPVFAGENNRLAVSLSAGTQGTLRVWFAGKALWRIAEAVSALTAIALLARPGCKKSCR